MRQAIGYWLGGGISGSLHLDFGMFRATTDPYEDYGHSLLTVFVVHGVHKSRPTRGREKPADY